MTSKNLDKKKLLNKMENKEVEENFSPIDSAKQVTTTEKKTKPKDPGRIAAGKKLAEHNKKAREAKKASQENKEIPNEKKRNSKRKQSRRIIFTDANSFSGQYCCFSCRIILQEKRVDELG